MTSRLFHYSIHSTLDTPPSPALPAPPRTSLLIGLDGPTNVLHGHPRSRARCERASERPASFAFAWTEKKIRRSRSSGLSHRKTIRSNTMRYDATATANGKRATPVMLQLAAGRPNPPVDPMTTAMTKIWILESLFVLRAYLTSASSVTPRTFGDRVLRQIRYPHSGDWIRYVTPPRHVSTFLWPKYGVLRRSMRRFRRNFRFFFFSSAVVHVPGCRSTPADDVQLSCAGFLDDSGLACASYSSSP
jgi:hypothetical protein